jgi:20S proteasome alpha/beta subunit
MTIIVSVKINDGIIMAADSAGTMASGQVYAHANKITNLSEGLPIGAMSTGAGGIGNESVETLLKDLGRRFDGRDPAHPEWRLDRSRYTMEEVAGRLRSFLFEEKAALCPDPTSLQLRICGYSAGRPLAEVWEVNMTGQDCPPPRRIMDETGFGVM